MITSFEVIEKYFEHLQINKDSFIHGMHKSHIFEQIMPIIMHEVMLYLQDRIIDIHDSLSFPIFFL